MGKFFDMTGFTFGKWTVLKLAEKRNGRIYWTCQCGCPSRTIRDVDAAELRRGNSKSCGCYNKESVTKRNTRHGKRYDRLYSIWRSMKKRCNNANDDHYYLYGGRGIKVCDEWNSYFIAFYNWAIQNGYNSNLTIDRINPNGDYEPSNCRWSTPKQQGRNRRSNRLITYNGETKSLTEWAEENGINYFQLRNRLDRNWPIEKALKTPLRKRSSNASFFI